MSFLKKLAERSKQVADEAAKMAALSYSKIVVPDEVREERLAICMECPELIQATLSCKKCGCFMSAKTYLSTASCPLKKWQKITIVSTKE